MTTTVNSRMRVFTTVRGNKAEVWNTKEVTKATGRTGGFKNTTVRTWVNVNTAAGVVTAEVPAGEGFRAERFCADAGVF